MLRSIVLSVLLLSMAPPVWAQVTQYGSESTFRALIKPGYLFENFDSYTDGVYQEPVLPLSQNGFTATLKPTVDVLFSLSGSMSTNSNQASLVVTFGGKPATAVGGIFWPTDYYGGDMVGRMMLTLDLADGTRRTFTVEQADSGSFVGFATDGVPITRLEVTADKGFELNCFPTVDDLYAGESNGSAVETVSIDIKPGALPNPINPGSKGVIPVAILSTDSFDAAAVNSATVTFGAKGTEAVSLKAVMADVNRDGRLDMLLHFRNEHTGIRCGDKMAQLKAKTFSLVELNGSDSIVTVGCK